MLAATITAALIYFMVQSSGALALSTACWDERLSRVGRNITCVGTFSVNSVENTVQPRLPAASLQFQIIQFLIL